MGRVVVRFTNLDIPPVEFDRGTLGVAAPGILVVQQDEEIIGMFPLHSVAAAYHPDGAAKIQTVKGVLA